MDGPASDETLLVGVADRDLGAFRALYERHAGWLAVRLARRCNDRDLVADAVQDTFVAVWQKPRSFRGDGDIAAWLWGIAIRRLVSRLRQRTDVAPVFGISETVAMVLPRLAVRAVRDRGAGRDPAGAGHRRRVLPLRLRMKVTPMLRTGP